MSLYPVECWLKGRDSVEYNEEQIRSVISHMTMANCTTYLSSKSFEKLDGLITEPYTDAKYTIEDISLSVTDQVRVWLIVFSKKWENESKTKFTPIK